MCFFYIFFSASCIKYAINQEPITRIVQLPYIRVTAFLQTYLFLGYVHTPPVQNGSDPILEQTISVHTVPFRLSTSVHTGPVCYGSVLNRSKKSSCFYQLSMRRIHVVAFKMAPKYQKEPVQVFTRWRTRQKEPVQVFTRWRIHQKEPVRVFTRWRIRQKEPVRVFTRWRIHQKEPVQVFTRWRIHQKEPVRVFTRWRIRQKEPVQVFTRWRIRLGPKRFQNLDLLFWRSSFRTWSGTGWRYG